MFILIVDNNRFYVTALMGMLQRAGFNSVRCVETGIECVHQVNRNGGPDVIIIDESQCFINGVDVIKNISISRPEIRIIILTAEESAFHVNQRFQKKSITLISKDSVISENLPHVLYSIFTEKLNPAKKITATNSFVSFRKSFANILNF